MLLLLLLLLLLVPLPALVQIIISDLNCNATIRIGDQKTINGGGGKDGLMDGNAMRKSMQFTQTGNGCEENIVFAGVVATTTTKITTAMKRAL